MGLINCCYQCTARHGGCHATCETYQAARKALDESKTKRDGINDAKSFTINQVYKQNKRKR